MPLARIVTRNSQDALGVAQYLVGRGFDVETVDSPEAHSTPADIEINIDRCTPEEALARAAALAEAAGADVFIAPGALPLPEAAALPASAGPQVTPSLAQDFTFGGWLVSDDDESAVPAQAASEGGGLGEAARHLGGLALEKVRHGGAALAAAFADLGRRLGRQAGAASQWLGRATTGASRRTQHGLGNFNQTVAVRRGAVREQRQREMETAPRREERQPQPAAQPAAELRPSARENTARVFPPPPPCTQWPVVEEQSAWPARKARRQPTSAYWRGAFTGAAAAAAIVMVAWAVASSHRAAPVASEDGSMVQQVPFGPVTLKPRAIPSPPAIAAPQSAPRETKPAPGVTQRKSRHTRLRAAQDNVAPQDEVVVRHYGAHAPAAPATATLNKQGPRRISDRP